MPLLGDPNDTLGHEAANGVSREIPNQPVDNYSWVVRGIADTDGVPYQGADLFSVVI